MLVTHSSGEWRVLGKVPSAFLREQAWQQVGVKVHDWQGWGGGWTQVASEVEVGG